MTVLLSLLLCGSTLLFSCQSGGGDGKTTGGEGSVDYSDFVFEDSGNEPGFASSTLTSFLTDGYVADTVRNNIADWLLTAYQKNPGIIDCIRDHSMTSAKAFLSFIADGWKMMDAGVSSVAVSETTGPFGRSIVWTNHKTGTFTDLDFIYGNAPGSRRDWTGFRTLWIYLDASAYGTDPVPFGIAFEENDVDSAGNLTAARETWGFRTGSSVTLYPDNGEPAEITVGASGTAINANTGRVVLPAGFTGWLRLALGDGTFFPYWNYPNGNGTLDLRDVHQFVMNAEGTASSAGGSLQIGPFLLSEERETAPEALSDPAFTEACPLRSLKNGEVNANDDIVFVFYGEFPGKLLTGMSYAYTLAPSAELKRAGDELTQALADVQYEDGYLGLFDGADRFGGGMNWDTWAQYHIMFGLLQWYKTTGSQTAYDVLIRSADGAMAFFRQNNRRYSYGTAMCNLGIAHVFALLFEETGNRAYLDEAESIIENDWSACGDWLNQIEAGKEFYEMKNNYGNRWEPLHSVMALGAVGRLTGNQRYLKAFADLYQSILKTDRRNTGAFSYGEEACGNLFAAGNAAVETCCTVAWMALTTDYLSLTLDSRAADEAELSYFNAMLGALMEGDRVVTYDTPSDGRLIPSQTSLAFQTRDFSPDFCCCQANASRGLCEISKWAVLNANNGIYLNWYGASAAQVKTPAGRPITLTLNTSYPRDGRIVLTVSGMTEPERFTLFLRVPGWASAFTVRTGEKTKTAEAVGCYLPVTGTWQNGASVEIEIGMTVHYLVGEQNCAGKTSVYYGPILLALDDNFAKVSLFDALSVEGLKNMTVSGDDGLLLSASVVSDDGKTVRLISFADVGRGGSNYRSWLTVKGTIAPVTYERGGTPIWCAGLS